MAKAKAGFDEMVETGPQVEENDDVRGVVRTMYAGDNIQFDDDEVAAPLARLAQALTPEVVDQVAKAGQWIVTGFDPQAALTVIPLTMSRTRARVTGEGEDRQTLCSSGDAITGHGDPGGACRSCAFAEWTANPRTKKNNPPECSISYAYGCYCKELGTLVEIRFKRTAINTATLINSVIKSRGTGKFALLLTSSSQKGPRGTYYVPVARVTEISAEDLELARALLGGSPNAPQLAQGTPDTDLPL